MVNIETVLRGDDVSVDVAVILRKLHFLEKQLYQSKATVHLPGFAEILINCRLPSTHTRSLLTNMQEDERSIPVGAMSWNCGFVKRLNHAEIVIKHVITNRLVLVSEVFFPCNPQMTITFTLEL
ncbi:hypothetical protein CDAR_428331 [Caerostris darwini]|uniref:Uncharacterized protein n=1 Tax=Caerostris darwini TaxID=1538125 RepID=A0AAV4PE51_9ARAC|nr:hypothetical protein CDAR_428331 [Caerostris darwini]